MIVAGLDLSYTSTGLCHPDGTTEAIKSKPEAFSGDAQRIDWITSAVVSKFGLASPHDILVVMEGYSFGALAKRERLGELGGVMKHRLWLLGVPLLLIPPSVLKKWQTGKGNAPKDQAYAAWTHRVGRVFAINDEADAHALWTMGMSLIGKPVMELPADHLDALKSVRLPGEIVAKSSVASSEPGAR